MIRFSAIEREKIKSSSSSSSKKKEKKKKINLSFSSACSSLLLVLEFPVIIFLPSFKAKLQQIAETIRRLWVLLLVLALDANVCRGRSNEECEKRISKTRYNMTAGNSAHYATETIMGGMDENGLGGGGK